MISEGYKCADQADEDFDFKKLLTYFNGLVAQITLLFIITLLLYANSIYAPFYLDDYPSIVENQAVHSLDNLQAIWNFSQARFIGYLSFAINYSDNNTTIAFHLFNISLHFLNAVALLFLVRGLLQATNNTQQLTLLPLLTALLFLVAPLQTQAITYIVQRLASMAALFYISSMTFYIYARLKKKWLFFIPVFIFALLAFFTKQNSASLPFALLLIEILFFHTFMREHLKKYFIFSAIISIIFIFSLLTLSGFDLAELNKITRDPQTIGHITRIEYFSTQLTALWHYIYLFFVPLSLHIDYDFPIQHSFFSFNVLIALLAHITIITLAILFRKKQPLALFAVLFYYLAHSVESSFFPIFDVFFEHRAYLPNLGLALLTALTLIFLLEKSKQILIASLIIILLLTGFAFLTYQRNALWNNPIELYQEETRLSPEKERVWASLGKYYLKQRMYKEALQSYGKALNLGRDGNTLHALPTTLLNTYFALLYTGQFDKAIYMESLVPIKKLTRHDKSIFYYMKGNRLSHAGDTPAAIHYLQKALAINPHYLDAKANLATNYLINKELKKAEKLLNEVLAVKPSHKTAQLYLKKIRSQE